MVTILIISIILCGIGIGYALYGYKRHIQAVEKLEWADKTYKYAYRAWPSADDKPVYYTVRDLCPGEIAVYGVYLTADGHLCHVAVKSFGLGETEDDREFAIREAEELLEHLKER